MPTTAHERPGGLRRWVGALSQSKAEQHAANVRDDSHGSGATAISECEPGAPTVVAGVLRSVTLRPREGVPAVEAELFDGSGRVLLVWLGRRRIGGIEPGRRLVAHGRLTCNTESPTIFNPQYELRPPAGSGA